LIVRPDVADEDADAPETVAEEAVGVQVEAEETAATPT
jgi:hypothetical protein